MATALLLAGCANPALREAQQLAVAGQHEQSLAVLDSAARTDPANNALRSALLRERELAITQLANQGDGARAAGQVPAARAALARLQAIDPSHPRTLGLARELDRAARLALLTTEARRALASGRTADAQAALRNILAEQPGHPAARELQQQLARLAPPPPAPSLLSAEFQKPVSLEFRDATLRSVFETLGRSSNVNFAFDKDVRTDMRISISLKNVSLDEAMRVILATQQLDRKLLNDSSVFIYPGTPNKQREYQELVTRSFYLVNADVKQAQLLVKTMAKTRDVFIDERLNLMIVRDTPEVVRLTERLIASIDLAEPEVLLEVEVMEIATNRFNELGLQWPTEISYGIPGGVDAFGGITAAPASALWSQRGEFRASIANPAVLATLRGTSGNASLIANPRLRARNREKARVQIGEKLPVFTTTSTANVGVSASVTYIDVGLKLEVEPSVQLDNDVVMKVNLEVSNLIGQVNGPQGSIAYRVGTRNATTSLRLRDGETQVLAGLINNEDRKSVAGVPGVSELPVVGRLFGVHGDTTNKTEVVLLITPHVVRNLGLPDAATLTLDAGVDANPGAALMRLRSASKVAVTAAGAGGSAAATATPSAAATTATEAVIEVTTSGDVAAGETVSVSLQNQSVATITGELQYDADLLQATDGSAGGRVAFQLEPRGSVVLVLRALPAAAGKSTDVALQDLAASGVKGGDPSVRSVGQTGIRVIAR